MTDSKASILRMFNKGFFIVLGLTALFFAAGIVVLPAEAQTPATFVNPTFNQAGYVTSNYGPVPVQELVAGDFNNDGFQDVIVLDSNANVNGWAILLGNGDGTFQPGQAIAVTGSYGNVDSIVTGDFNKDGDLDFAVTWSGTNPTLQVFLGNGAGGFTLEGTYTLPCCNYYDLSNGLATADLRGNGHLDLIVAELHNVEGEVEVLLGNGDGTFQAPVQVASTIGAPVGIATADLNHDGKMDMVVASNDSGDGFYVVLGNGDGTFQTPVFYSQGSNYGVAGIAIGSLTTKKYEDVVLVGTGGAYIYLSKGDGTYAAPTYYSSSYNATSVVIADVNGDKKDDLVVGSATSGATWILLGKGNGTFSSGTAYNNGGVTTDVAVADFNGDGKLDFATASNAQDLTVVLGNGDGTFRSSSEYGNTASAIMAIASADLNGDGYPDIVTGGGGTGVGVTVQLGSAHGVLGAPVSIAVGCGEANRSGINSVALGDVTGDGKVDIVATSLDDPYSCYENVVAVLTGLGTGKFKTPVYYSTGSTQQSYNATLGDFNGDGKLDIVVSNADGSLSVLLNTGKGVFGTATVIAGASGNAAGAIVVGDFNKDGKLDIAITAYNQKDINILLGNGDGTFQAPISIPATVDPDTLAVGDFNKDGKLDLAVSSFDGGGTLVIFTGNGNGNFTLGNSYALTPISCQFGNSLPYFMAAGDLNGDGNLDLAVGLNENNCGTQYNGTELLGDAIVFTGKGDGTFTEDIGPWMGGGIATNGIALADFNNDGSTDIAVAAFGQNGSEQWVSVLQNNTEPVSVSPLHLAFATKAVGSSDPAATVIITNDQATKLEISKISLGGADPGDFTLKSGCGSSLLPGANCTETITFKPTATGARTATLSIVDGIGTQTVSLAGKGEETITGFTPTSGPVGTVVTITGTFLTGTTKVTFDNVVATTFNVVSATEVTATVPTGAKTGKIGVTTTGVVVDSKTSFTVN